jgi:rare lipoprotein A
MPQMGRNWQALGRFDVGATLMKSALTAAAIALCAAIAMPTAPAFAKQTGKASWYSLPGNRTACGEKMNPRAYTAAHRTLPCGTRIKVTNRKNGKSVVVRVNDRGPFVRGRIVDVSKSAGAKIGMLGSGVATVSVAVVD